jgi:hypothetical protein
MISNKLEERSALTATLTFVSFDCGMCLAPCVFNLKRKKKMKKINYKKPAKQSQQQGCSYY